MRLLRQSLKENEKRKQKGTASHPLLPNYWKYLNNSIIWAITSRTETIFRITSGCILIEILISILPPFKQVVQGSWLRRSMTVFTNHHAQSASQYQILPDMTTFRILSEQNQNALILSKFLSGIAWEISLSRFGGQVRGEWFPIPLSSRETSSPASSQNKRGGLSPLLPNAGK